MSSRLLFVAKIIHENHKATKRGENAQYMLRKTITKMG